LKWLSIAYCRWGTSENDKRLEESINTAMYHGNDIAMVVPEGSKKDVIFQKPDVSIVSLPRTRA
jgi:hypothetical protein